MSTVEFVPINEIIVKDRARKLFSVEGIAALTNDIRQSEIGLIHPILIKENGELVTGERRLKVVRGLHEDGDTIRFAGKPIPNNTIPAIRVKNDFDILQYLIAEAGENNSREAFTWQEKVALDYRIASLQQIKLNAQKAQVQAKTQDVANIPEITPETVAVIDDIEDDDSETIGKPTKVATNAITHLLGLQTNPERVQITREAVESAVKDLHKGEAPTWEVSSMQSSVMLAKALEDPELAEQLRKAPTKKEAEKLLKVAEKRRLQQQMAVKQGKELRDSDRHVVINGDCLEELAKIKSGSVDLCLTDPPYGISSHKFGVAARDTGFHTYDDSPEAFEALLIPAIKEVSRILKPAAHLYLFCDISKFLILKKWVEENGSKDNPWKVQSFPLHWIKVNGARCPHPGFTFRKTVEYILFAYRGGKESNHQYDSHFEISTKRSEIHGAAKEPDGLKYLLNNSAKPGDLILDFCAGSGSLVVAAHELKMKTIMIEKDTASYGRCVERVKSLLEEK